MTATEPMEVTSFKNRQRGCIIRQQMTHLGLRRVTLVEGVWPSNCGRKQRRHGMSEEEEND